MTFVESKKDTVTRAHRVITPFRGGIMAPHYFSVLPDNAFSFHTLAATAGLGTTTGQTTRPISPKRDVVSWCRHLNSFLFEWFPRGLRNGLVWGVYHKGRGMVPVGTCCWALSSRKRTAHAYKAGAYKLISRVPCSDEPNCSHCLLRLGGEGIIKIKLNSARHLEERQGMLRLKLLRGGRAP